MYHDEFYDIEVKDGYATIIGDYCKIKIPEEKFNDVIEEIWV